MVLDDKALLAIQEKGVLESTIVPTGLKAVTELTTALHYDDIVCAKQIGEWSFRTVFKWTFKGNDVAIQKTKDVDTIADSMDEFAKELLTLDKLWCNCIVHFYEASFIRKHVMFATEYSPFGS